jgi:hypothetical protein
MNMLLLVGMASHGGGPVNPVWMDSCALCLFIAGFVSLGVGGYLLYKAPKLQPVRVVRRRDF